MAERWVRVIADDLTGACDVGAALLPSPHRIVVASLDAAGPDGDDGTLVVRNTQSRTVGPAAGAARVWRVLADVPRGAPGTVVKKIDTALRGSLGAELDAAMDACGAARALVLPAIPEVGRTTVGGVQLIDGVPVDRTAFARDPQNPVRDARVAETFEATSRRRARSVGLDELQAHGAAAVLARAEADGAPIVVGDAESDADLARWLAGVVAADDPTIVLVGSIGLARAWRATRGWNAAGSPPLAAARPDARGVLVVSGSAHPVTRSQLARAVENAGAIVVGVEGADPSGVAASLRAGAIVCLVAPEGSENRSSVRVLDALATTTARVVAEVSPRAMVLVGGETAHGVLVALGNPRLGIDAMPAPLAVRATVLDGVLAGMPLVTKGGSTGPPERLAELIGEVRR